MFELDSRLQQDSVVVGAFPLSLLLMSKDANYPWFILVPQRQGLTELHHLNNKDFAQFTRESRHLSQVLMAVFNGYKLNVAALGNIVSQLHIHHIVRFKEDAAWPNPVWGAKPPLRYEGGEQQRMALLADNLAEGFKPA